MWIAITVRLLQHVAEFSFLVSLVTSDVVLKLDAAIKAIHPFQYFLLFIYCWGLPFSILCSALNHDKVNHMGRILETRTQKDLMIVMLKMSMKIVSLMMEA